MAPTEMDPVKDTSLGCSLSLQMEVLPHPAPPPQPSLQTQKSAVVRIMQVRLDSGSPRQPDSSKNGENLIVRSINKYQILSTLQPIIVPFLLELLGDSELNGQLDD